ncbi:MULTISPECIES: ATP-dependent DNA ligase [unclassified Streptomyces]|uniref:ATP-dependent DNA ligase n=1 Tax=unclassified Streptomyces TaxID=2593676 RepID=UPI002E1DBB0B
MTWTLPEPMLTTPVSVPDLRPGCAAEPKWDGFRALVSVDAGRVVLRSRRGTEMGPSFSEVVAGAVQLQDATALDGELVVWDASGRLAFDWLQNRLARRGAAAARAAEEWPAHFVAFDLLRLSGTDTTSWLYRRRRAALESVFAARRLSAPWALCPSTTEADVVREWLTWASVGMEGVVFKRLNDAYRPSARDWQKYKFRETSEAIVGAITGSLVAPRTLLLGRYDTQPSVRRPHHHPRPGGRCCGRWPTRSGTGRSSVDRLVILRRVGQPGKTCRHAGGTRAGGGSRRRRRPRRLRTLATSRTLAPRPPRPLPTDVPLLTSPPH